MTDTVAMLRPSQWMHQDGHVLIDDERVMDVTFVKGGVRVATLKADGTFRRFTTSGRRQYKVTIRKVA